MQTVRYCTVLLASLIFFLAGCVMQLGTGLTRLNDLSYTNPTELEFRYFTKDKHGTYWALFISNWYGYHDLWLTSSSDGHSWDKPIFTTIPAVGGCYNWNIYDYKLSVKLVKRLPDKLQFWRFRTSWYALEDSCVIPIRDLVQDVDADGLTDLAEYVLHTNPSDLDTDNDGKADGYDQNPLSAPADTLSKEASLHKFIIEQELSLLNSTCAVLVEKYGDFEIEYDRDSGIVLSMPSDSIDAYLQEYDYGIPVFTANVEPATNGMFKATFTLFVTPEDAEGWEALYKWEKSEWKRKKTRESWVATK